MESIQSNKESGPSVFRYTSAKQFLLDSLDYKKKKNPQFSVRQWAKKMGLQSHTLLTLLIQGKRPLRVKHAKFLSLGLGLSMKENLFFQTLIQYEAASSIEEKELCKMWLVEQNPGQDFTTRELDEFSVISDWIHMAILGASRLKDFDGKPETLKNRIGSKTSVHEIRSAMNRMMEMGLLEKQADGNLWPAYQRITNKDDVANAGARKYHQQVIELAKNAIEEQGVTEREYQSLSIAIRKEDLDLAKEMIKKFRMQFVQALGLQTREADELYQLNVQFFRLTESPAAVTSVTAAVNEGAETKTNTVKTVSS